MDDDLHDDFFADDIDLDGLPANTLDELQERAFLSTQAKTNAPDVTNSSDYGLEDEDVIDLDAQQTYARGIHANLNAAQAGEITQREQWRRHRLVPSPLPLEQQQAAWTRTQPDDVLTSHAELSPRQECNGNVRNAQHPPKQTMDVSALQARISELERDRIALQKAAEDAKSAILIKAGEIAIVRANQEKATKEYERRLAAIEQLHSEEIGRQKSELEIARKDRETVETSNRFLEHDLAHGPERARTLKRTLTVGHGNAARSRVPAQPSPLTTPRKDRHLPFRDGFDDDEVVMLSPSKSRGASRPSTPKAGIKRKRASTSDQSPHAGHALLLAEPEPSPRADMATDPSSNRVGPSVQAAIKPVDEKFEFLQRVLNHRPGVRSGRSIEILSNYALSPPLSRSISSLIYDHLTQPTLDQDLDAFRTTFCNFLITLWAKCLENKYYAPLYHLIEIIQFVLLISPSSLLIGLMTGFIPLCLKTADLVALPNAKASKSRSLLDAPSNDLMQHIDPLDYLGFLHQLALECCPFHESLTVFWTAMEFDFVLLMLHKAQPIAQITQMLQLLLISVLPSSFGAISTRPMPQQTKNESDTLDRLSVLLFETPQAPPDRVRYTPLEIANLRTAVLGLIQSLAYTAYGGNLLAAHRLAIGRLVRFLHEAILSMYMYHPTTHCATVTHVNATVYILAHLTSAHATTVDIRAKLAMVPGGSQKHLASLSRVAFAEGYSTLEKGIEGEAAEAAHRMLDELLSPEEGEAVVSVFSSAV